MLTVFWNCQGILLTKFQQRDHLFGTLKQHLSGELFPDDVALQRAVCAWFQLQPQEFYAAGFQGLVKWWDRCLNLYGDYVEK